MPHRIMNLSRPKPSPVNPLIGESEARIIESIPDCAKLLDLDGRLLHINAAGLRLLECPNDSALKGRPLVELYDHDDLDRVQAALASALQGSNSQLNASSRSQLGMKKWWELEVSPVFAPDGSVERILVISRDITTRERREEFRTLEHNMLEMIASGKSLEKALEGLVLLIEEYSEGAICCVLMLGDDRTKVQEMCAPSFSDAYNRAVFGLAVGPRAGSCGTAMYRREKVIIEDIYNDPLWEGFDEIKRLSGGRGCWSTPILSDEDEVVGSFAIYAREARLPTDEEVGLMDSAANFARVAIDKQRAQQGLRRAEKSVSNLAGRLIHAQEEAQRRLARELHDDLSQNLALLSVELEIFGQNPALSAPEIARRMDHFSKQAKGVSSELHRLSHTLHPAKLDQLGLETALRGFCRELAVAHRIAISFSANEVPKSLSKDIALCFYRVAQEALHNVIKHSGATQAEVSLTREGADLALTISDNGSGFDPASGNSSGSLGIVGMGERARFVGGCLKITSAPEGGTRIEVRVSLETKS